VGRQRSGFLGKLGDKAKILCAVMGAFPRSLPKGKSSRTWLTACPAIVDGTEVVVVSDEDR
jgi:hypothetical protein